MMFRIGFLFSLFVYIFANECGKSPSYQRYSDIFDTKKSGKKILNGQPAEFGEWPWLVTVGIRKGGRLIDKCTGAIIGKEWILTAAHCVNETFQMQVGTGNTDKNKQLRLNVTAFKHPKYNKKYFFAFDVALLKLDKPLKYDEAVQPICLSKSLKLKKNEVVANAGWGFTFEYLLKRIPVGDMLGKKPDVDFEAIRYDILEETHLTVRDQKDCNVISTTNPWVRYICTGGLNFGSHLGDSGGPLMARRNGRWYHAGVVHIGALFATETRIDVHVEAVHVETMQFCDFIKNTTSGKVECEP